MLKRLRARATRTLQRLLIRFLAGAAPVLARLPDSLVGAAGRTLGLLAYCAWARVRKVALSNLSDAYPEKTPRQVQALARSTFANWGCFVLEFLRLPAYSPEELHRRVTVEGREYAESALERRNGVILATGHLGCFEMGAAYAASEGYGVSVIVRYAKTQELTEGVTRLREKAGYRVLAYDARGFRAMRCLKNNEIVCILTDQDSGPNGTFVDFFGRPASTPPGPAILACRSGAALIPAWVVQERPGHHRIILEPEIPLPSSHPTPEQVQSLTQEMTRRLEAIIRRYPDQWLWMHRRWKTQPPTGDHRDGV